MLVEEVDVEGVRREQPHQVSRDLLVDERRPDDEGFIVVVEEGGHQPIRSQAAGMDRNQVEAESSAQSGRLSHLPRGLHDENHS